MADETMRSAIVGELVIDTNITGSNTNGPAITNTAAGSGSPTLCPDKSDTDTGIGHATGDALTFVVGGLEAMRIAESGNTTLLTFNNATSVGKTADVGSSQGDGVITSTFNVYSTVANAGDAATLPSSFIVGMIVFIKNDGANSMDVFPASGDDAGAGVNTAVAIAAGNFAVFISTAGSSTWTKLMGGTA